MSLKVNYKLGPSSSLDKLSKVAGSLIVTNDTGEMYLDISADQRIKITDPNKQDKIFDIGSNISDNNRDTFLTFLKSDTEDTNAFQFVFADDIKFGTTYDGDGVYNLGINNGNTFLVTSSDSIRMSSDCFESSASYVSFYTSEFCVDGDHVILGSTGSTVTINSGDMNIALPSDGIIKFTNLDDYGENDSYLKLSGDELRRDILYLRTFNFTPINLICDDFFNQLKNKKGYYYFDQTNTTGIISYMTGEIDEYESPIVNDLFICNSSHSLVFLSTEPEFEVEGSSYYLVVEGNNLSIPDLNIVRSNKKRIQACFDENYHLVDIIDLDELKQDKFLDINNKTDRIEYILNNEENKVNIDLKIPYQLPYSDTPSLANIINIQDIDMSDGPTVLRLLDNAFIFTSTGYFSSEFVDTNLLFLSSGITFDEFGDNTYDEAWFANVSKHLEENNSIAIDSDNFCITPSDIMYDPFYDMDNGIVTKINHFTGSLGFAINGTYDEEKGVLTNYTSLKLLSDGDFELIVDYIKSYIYVKGYGKYYDFSTKSMKTGFIDKSYTLDYNNTGFIITDNEYEKLKQLTISWETF